MSRKLIIVAMLGLLLAGSSSADDLYKVRLSGKADARKLNSLQTDVVFGSDNDYLVLVNPEIENGLRGSGLQVELIAQDVSRGELAIDGRLDRANVDQYPLLFEKDNFRLYRVSEGRFGEMPETERLFPIGSVRPEVVFTPETKAIPSISLDAAAELDSLVALVNTDSLRLYTETLQAFYRRTAGTLPNYQSRDWIASKLESFGYDSVVIDSFQPVLYTVPEECQNVIAYKIGSVYPDHQVIIGAHRDAVSVSPGADDNGSGTAGVLEIARILKDAQTDMTIIFILFDAEEFGLFGSWHYAEDANARGDKIVYMLNLDMIGHYENSTYAALYYGADDTYSQLWQTVGQTYGGVYGVLSGASSGSDHFPFSQLGYDVTFVAEYNFSTVYHSSQDSTTYMDFNYMTKLVKASLATAYTVNATEGPEPSVAFAYPGGLPSMVMPGVTTSLQVEATGIYGGVINPGTLQLNYSVDGGAATSVSATSVGGDLYEAEIPAVACKGRVSYYFSAEEMGGITYLDPPAPDVYEFVSANAIESSFADDFETDKGWVSQNLGATSGNWERGVPVNDPSWTYDPLSDGDGSGQCYLTQNVTGNTDIDDGAVRLISPLFDMSNGGDIAYDYYLMLTDEGGAVDRLLVEICSDGTGSVWTEIARHTTSGGLQWRHNVITESQLTVLGVDLTGTMQVRFTANDANTQSIVEAGVDGFSVNYASCESPGCCGLYTGGFTGNTDCDIEGKYNLADITRLIDNVYLSKLPLCCPENGNVDGDAEGKVALADITKLIDRIYLSHSPTAACQ